jgi:hypothetical protein
MATKNTKLNNPRLAKSAPEAAPERFSVDDVRAVISKIVPGWDDLTEAEQFELAEMALALEQMPQPAKVTLARKPDGEVSLGIAGSCEALGLFKLQKTFAAVSLDPVHARASELLNYLGSVSADNAISFNAALSFIDSMVPQDQAEALLLVQMYVTHDAAIRALRQLGKAECMPQFQTFGNLGIKLLRAFQGQMETLERVRRGGEQVVRNIHVDNRGGQAMIAENVHSGG